MAVELRCPDCRAKLRLKAAPEVGTEVECPKCGTVFPAPEPEPDADEDAPKKKKKPARDEDADDKPKKPKKKKKAKGDPSVPRKRKAKKQETSKLALIAVVSAGLLMLLCMSGVLIWYFTRTSKAVEMFYYVPEDAQVAIGINLGHAQKYPKFYESLAGVQTGQDFKIAGDAVAKAAGTDMDTLVDYMVKAESFTNGSAIVYRTKEEFDGGALAKIPGVTKQSLDGKTYYLAPGILPGNQRARVFSPTNRLIVVTPESTKEAAFKKMLNGHAGSQEKTLGVRMGQLGKRVTRGTFWQMTLFDEAVKLPAPPAEKSGGSEDTKAQQARVFYDTANGAKGVGAKASLGSREVRFELMVWYKDSDKPSSVATKWKESELGKGDEGEPPRWYKDSTNTLGDRKVAAQLLSNIGFGSSGEVFYVKSAVETVDLQQTSSTAMGMVLGISNRNQGIGAGGGPGGPGGGPTPAPMPRRRRFGPTRARR